MTSFGIPGISGPDSVTVAVALDGLEGGDTISALLFLQLAITMTKRIKICFEKKDIFYNCVIKNYILI